MTISATGELLLLHPKIEIATERFQALRCCTVSKITFGRRLHHSP